MSRLLAGNFYRCANSIASRWIAMFLVSITLASFSAKSVSGQTTGSRCNAPEAAIPDDDPNGVGDVIVIPTNGTIQDINVEILISHTFQGDLVIELSHWETGTTAVLIFRPGDSDGTGFGFSANNFGDPSTGERFVFDDEAEAPYDAPLPDGWQDPGIPDPGLTNPTGSWIPYGAQGASTLGTLRGFDGEDISGHWTLNVSDHLAAAAGTFHEWCITWTVLDNETLLENDCGGYNLSFETGDFTGWSVRDYEIPSIPIRVDSVGAYTPFFDTSPTDGVFSLWHTFDGFGPDVLRVGQDMTFPPGTAYLLFDYRAGWNLGGAGANRLFRVNVEPTGGGTPLQSDLILTLPAGEFEADTGNMTGVVDVSDFVEGTVHVVFEWEIFEIISGPATFQLDNIRCAGDDCNENGVDDRDEISNGSAIDCNFNHVPDDCETDSDGDVVIDACDECANDANKLVAGVCGCGVADDDTDGDGVPDCFDECPNDPNKIATGFCGCGAADFPDDSDDDGIIDCIDNCPNTPNADQADSDGNEIGDACELPPGGSIVPCGMCGGGAATVVPLMLIGVGVGKRWRRSKWARVS